jgi:heme/copper-type cytochrome/quinol oxidase subunit 3
MPIKVTCRCGQQFAAKDELAGKVVKCPKCQESLKIGASPAPQTGGAVGSQAAAPSAVAKLLDEVGFHLHEKEDDSVQHCPACDREISDHAVLCVYCGYNLESGKFVKGMGGGPGAIQKAEGHEGAALMLLKKAERAITQDKDEERKMRTQGMPLWMIITILSIIASFTVGMSVLPRDQAFKVSGYVWMSVCGSLAIVYWFRLVFIAFKESAKHGLMFQFVPFYALHYVVKRWDDCGKLFMTHVILSLLVIPGYMLVMVAPKLKSEAAQEVTRAWNIAPAAVSALLDPSTSGPVQRAAA